LVRKYHDPIRIVRQAHLGEMGFRKDVLRFMSNWSKSGRLELPADWPESIEKAAGRPRRCEGSGVWLIRLIMAAAGRDTAITMAVEEKIRRKSEE